MLSKLASFAFLFVLLAACAQDAGNNAATQEKQRLYMEAIQFAETGQLESAHRIFSNLLESDSSQLPIIVDLRILDDALSGTIQRKTASFLFQAIRFTQQNNMMLKLVALDSAIILDPEYAYSYNERGIAHFEMGNLDAAIDDRVKATEIDPEYFEAYFNMALACEKAQRFEEAIAAFDNFLKHAPDDYRWHRDYAQIKIRQLKGEPAPAVTEDTLGSEAFQ